MRYLIFLSLALLWSNSLKAQTLCNNNLADSFPCSFIDLQSRLDLEQLGDFQKVSDSWGWTHSDSGREFALVGGWDGCSFVEISDPVNPVFIGKLPTETEASNWRDVKVYKNYAFIVSEADGHGMQIFDLSQLLLADDLPVEFENSAHYDGFGSCHNIVINEESGYAFGVGTNTFGGGLHIVNIQNPLNPIVAGAYNDHYVHDAQVLMYGGPDTEYQGREIAFACTEDHFQILDVTDKTDVEIISETTTEFTGYIHQGWLAQGQSYFLVNDELDEIDGIAATTRTFIFDVSDLDSPVFIDFHESDIVSSDHNLYTKGSLVFQANYTSGLRVLQMTDLENAILDEVAYFDTEPSLEYIGTDGAWNVYPYFPSNNIIVSSESMGLFVLKLNQNVLDLSVDSQIKSTISISPNPVNDRLKIQSSQFITHLPVIRNAMGQRVENFEMMSSTKTEMELDVSGLSKGVYTIYIPELNSTLKWIKL